MSNSEENSGQIFTNLLHNLKEPVEVKIESQIISGKPSVMFSGQGVQLVGSSVSLNIGAGSKIESLVMNSNIVSVRSTVEKSTIADGFNLVINKVNQSSHN